MDKIKFQTIYFSSKEGQFKDEKTDKDIDFGSVITISVGEDGQGIISKFSKVKGTQLPETVKTLKCFDKVTVEVSMPDQSGKMYLYSIIPIK